MSISAGTDTVENNKEAPQKTKNRAIIRPSNPSSGYLKDLRVFIHEDTGTAMFVAALFTVAKTWKPPECLLTDDLREKMGYIHTSDCQPFSSHAHIN